MTPISDPFDDLAAMFLSEEEDDSTPPTAQAVELEFVLVGHLPVRAGLWLTPYADARARQCGTTALMRLDRDDPSLQLLRDGEHTVGDALRPGAPMLDAVQECARRSSHWIVYAGDDARLRHLLMSRPSRLTILSSADDVAIVRAYQIIKDLASTAEQEGMDMPTLSLAVLGADPARAQQVLNRVRPTTSAFLGLDVELIATLPQMDHEIRSSSYLTFANTERPAVTEVGMVIRDAIASHAQSPTPTMPTLDVVPPAQITITEDELAELHESSAADDSELTDAIEALERSMTPDPEPTPAPIEDDAPPVMQEPEHEAVDEPVDAPTPPLVETIAGASIAATRTIRMAPAANAHVEAKDMDAEPHEAGAPKALATHVDGLRALPVRCPSHERVELAVDDTGSMHLLGRVTDFRDLPVVQQWCWSHRELITLACRDMNVAPRQTATWHVFTETPASVSDLHGSDIRLHVLAPVSVNGQTAWFAAPLN